MSKNLELQLLLRLNDQMSRGLKSALQAAQNEAKGVEDSVSGVAAATARIKTTPIERMTSALRTMRSAASSAHETLMNVAKAGAAATAGGYVLKSAAERPMAYDRRLALMANTAYADRDVAGRIAGKAELDKAIRASTINGHGTPEQAAETLNTLAGSGAMGEGKAGLDSSMKLLPMLQAAAHGTGASANDLAQIAIAAKQNMGLRDEQIPIAISKAIRAGQLGGFELSNMSKWLPQQMAMAGNNGMKGMSGFESLIAANQATRMTAGTADEAGNNLVNLLQKVTSSDTANDFKKQNIDLYGSLTANMAKGMNSLEAFVGMVQQIGSKDKKYLELKAKADSTKNEPEKKKLYEAMADIMMAKGIGKTVQDRQALSGLFGMMSPTGKYHEVLSGVKKENGSEVNTSSSVVDNTLDAKADRLGNAKTYASIDALSAIDKPLGLLLDGVSKGAEEFPGFTAALYAATVAVTALAASSGVSALLGGGKGGEILSYLKGILPGGITAGTPGVLARGARALTLPGLALTGLVEGGGAAVNAYRGKDSSNMISHMVQGTAFSDLLGETVARTLAAFGNQNAKEAVQINLHLDGEQIATVVNKHNARTATRN